MNIEVKKEPSNTDLGEFLNETEMDTTEEFLTTFQFEDLIKTELEIKEEIQEGQNQVTVEFEQIKRENQIQNEVQDKVQDEVQDEVQDQDQNEVQNEVQIHVQNTVQNEVRKSPRRKLKPKQCHLCSF